MNYPRLAQHALDLSTRRTRDGVSPLAYKNPVNAVRCFEAGDHCQEKLLGTIIEDVGREEEVGSEGSDDR